MKKEIEKNGGNISEDVSKVIHLSIINVTLTKSLVRYRSIIDAIVQLGDGHIQDFNANASGRLEQAVDVTMVNLVVSILNDHKVRSYLE